MLSRAASGTTVVQKDLPELCAEARTAFLGTVADVRSQWTESAPRGIETIVTFTRVTPLLGNPGPEPAIRLPGGEVDGMREEVAGLPRFHRGERVILLLGAGGGVRPIAGFHQGLFRVMDVPSGPVVLSADRHPPLAGAGGDVDAVAPGAPPEGGVPLDTFLDILRDQLQHADSGR